jgi:hypothetical protein
MLIASPVFDALRPAPPSPKAEADEVMDVDESVAAPANGTPAPASIPAAAEGSKFAPPIDATSGDTVPEVTIYVRLLLILANLDADKVELVCLI